jgi:hypothetical protein
MSVIIFFSASKNNFFCRNDVQAIDFLRKGSYAPVSGISRRSILLVEDPGVAGNSSNVHK